MVNVQNVGLKVNLRYYRVIPGMRNLGAICVITNLQWTNSKKSYPANSDSFFLLLILNNENSTYSSLIMIVKIQHF